MLDPSVLGSPAAVNDVREQAKAEPAHPLDRDRAGESARRLVYLLAADAEYRDQDERIDATARPIAAFAPAIILRRRSQQGLVEIFRRIAEEIERSGRVPDGIRPLVDADHVPAAGPATERSDGAVVRVDDEPFLPLPVNDTQLRILRQVDTHAQTLIQGPPGTGKTHTAAVLISHLLAQGKRVLITAQTDRALREVRDKLPEEIRPLAVSVIGASREDMSDLRVAVERIGTTAAEFDADEARRAIDGHVTEIDVLRRRRAELDHRLVEAREREVRVHEIAGYRGTAAELARRLAEDRSTYGWIEEFVVAASPEPPVSGSVARRWLDLLRDEDLRADEPAAERRLADLTTLPDPDGFTALVEAEHRAAAAAERFAGLRRHPAYAVVATWPADRRIELGRRFRAVVTEMEELTRLREPWLREALDDIRNGRRDVWADRRVGIAQLTEQAMTRLAEVGAATDIRIDGPTIGLAQLTDTLLDHLGDGGRLRTHPDGRPRTGIFTPRAVKDAATLFDRVLVDGRPPTSTSRLRPLKAWLETRRLLDALTRAWPPGAVPHPGHGVREQVSRYAAELELLDRVLRLGADLEHTEQQSHRRGLPHPYWDDARVITDYGRLPDAIAAAEAAVTATGHLDALADRIQSTADRHDSEATAEHLLAAVRERDVTAFSRATTRLAWLHRVRGLAAERDEIAARFTAATPALAAAVRSTPQLPAWTDRLHAFEKAWDWMTAWAWLAGHAGDGVDAMQQEIIRIEDTIRRHVAGIAATRAWSHAVAPTRLSRGARASLEQYAALVRRYGKTGGQYKVQRLAEIREAMDRCRPAVPVWIMPIYRIADQQRATPAMFDVVVVDEASQAGLDATFLQYLAPRIVVIGDDKQVSPSAVGVDQQQLRDLAQQYLYDDQYRSTWQDPQRSLFDEARMRFGGMITLTEHRRSVPEIIGFSNRIAYEPDGVRLVPVRQFGPDRLDPVVPVLVEDGYERGATTNRVNPPEVDAIVARVESCIADPRYAGLTIGVISLLGTAQAKTIEKLLLERIPPEEWAARDLRCGDAADFQGSERDVMFLSMVAAPGRRLPALTAPQYIQRYNVAASRAKDQMWVFHSVRLDQLTSTEDMRFQLLDYCYGVRTRAGDDEHGLAGPAVPEDVRVTPFDSLFEQRVRNRVTDRGYCVVPQYPALGYRIDLVVIGAAARLAIECDGDHWHGPEVYQRDMARQRELERCGWTFVRIRESDFVRDPAAALAPVWEKLVDLAIHPSGWTPPRADTGQQLPS
jgi:very-short-patch-repair endonuclease